jgi:xyloglucan-specific endo-beta-1,4-glucanase
MHGGGLPVDRVCGHGESIRRGRFLLVNNLWGARFGSGEQCLEAEDEGASTPAAAGEPIAWSTDWRWAGPSDSVKSYAAAILGWHWGLVAPDPALPVRLSELAVARSDWEYRLAETEPGTFNVAYDIWIASEPDPQAEQLTDEIMIWLNRGGGATPIGAFAASVDVDGAAWELWQGPHPHRGWTVHSFVRTPGVASASLELRRFFDHLGSRGLDPERYVVGIEAGTEIFTGAGRLDTLRYSVEIGRGGG